MNKEIILAAAQKAADLIRTDFQQNTRSHTDLKTSIQDIVTETDKNSQQLIVRELQLAMQQAGISDSEIRFIGEENKLDTTEAKHVFVIDPMDGTTNFAAGLPYFCISIAYALDHELQLGLVLNPITNEYLWSKKGNGSWYVHGQQTLQLKAPAPKPLSQILIATHLNSVAVVAEQFAWYQNLYGQVRGERNCGSLTWDLCLMALGVFGATLNQGCYIWDVAAGKVILEELGIEFFDTNGDSLLVDWQNPHQKLQLIVTNPSYKEAILAAKPK